MLRFLVRGTLVMLVLLGTVAAGAAEFPPIGKPAPDFFLRKQDEKGVGLSEFRGKWLVLFFYQRDFHKVCTVLVKNFQRDLARYQELNANVVGISVGEPDGHRAFAERHGLQFPLLVDPNNAVAKAYNSYQDVNPMMILRHTFLIDPEGNVAKVFTKVNPTTHSPEVLKALAELQAARKQ
jgi:thioredoxin-dependent peroxiredoxin